MKILALIEKNETNYYQISCDTEVSGCYFGGYGYSAEEAKEDFVNCIQEMRELTVADGGEFPDVIEVEFKYDIPSFFNFFDFINISRFAKRAGINESKMRQYKLGLASASEETMNKITSTIHQIGMELQAVRL